MVKNYILKSAQMGYHLPMPWKKNDRSICKEILLYGKSQMMHNLRLTIELQTILFENHQAISKILSIDLEWNQSMEPII